MTADDLTVDEICADRDLDNDDLSDDGNVVFSGSISTSTSPSYSYTVGNSNVGNMNIGGTSTLGSGTSFNFSTSTLTTTPVPKASTPIFDLLELGIQQIGSFDSSGMAVGWIVSASPLPPQYPISMSTAPVITLGPSPDYFVHVRGIYSRYFTNQRRNAMGLLSI